MIKKLKKYINQSPRIKYFEMQILFFCLVIYFLILIFGLLLVSYDLIIQFNNYDFWKKISGLNIIVTLFFMIYFMFYFLILSQKIKRLSKNFFLSKIKIFLYITLMFLFFDIFLLWFENSEINQYLKIIWNTLKIDFYFILGYLYIKYSKRAHAYFNFYEKITPKR